MFLKKSIPVCSLLLYFLPSYENHIKIVTLNLLKVVGGCTVCKEYLGTCYVIFNDNKYHTGERMHCCVTFFKNKFKIKTK